MCPRLLNEEVLRWDRRGGIFSTPRSKGMGLQGVENTLTKEWQIDMLEKGQAESRPWIEPPGGEEAWQASVARLKEAHMRLKAALSRLTDEQLLGRPEPGLDRTLLELVLSSGSAHEAHHGGQLSYLRGLQGPGEPAQAVTPTRE